MNSLSSIRFVQGGIAAHVVSTLALLTLAATCTISVRASDARWWGQMQFGGFLSQGYLLTTGNNHFGETTGGGSPDFREMAFNASLPLGSKVRAGAQAFAQRLGKYGDDKVVIDWAVVDYNFGQQFGLRAGRIKLPRGLYNEALDLDMTRPFVLLPPSLYDARLRDFQAGVNGGMAYGTLDSRWGSFDYKAFYGRVDLRRGSGVQDMLTRADIVERMDIDGLYGATLFWSGWVDGLRVGASYLKQDNFNYLGWSFSTRTQAYTRRTADIFSNDRYIGSVEYMRGPWTFATEWEHQSTHDHDSNRHRSGNLFYVSAARRFGDRWEIGSYYSGTRKSRGMSASAFSSSRRLDEYAGSLKFSPDDHLTLKLEAHYIDGTASVLNVDGSPNPRSTRKETWHLFAAKTTFAF